ncbi:MAG TPA: acetate--CoA ligase family protein, partial [Caldimonas sp.]
MRAALAAVLPPTWSRGNPIDIIGDAPVERYTATLKALLDDRSAGAILFLHAPTAIVHSEDIARACVPIARQGHDRVLSCWLGDPSVSTARQIFEAAGVADFETPEEAVRAFAMLSTLREGRTLLGEFEAKQLLRAHAIPAVETVETVAVAPTAAAAADAAEALGYPVALKIVSPEITHKSDVGGVCLDLADAQRVRSAAAQMLQRVTAERPEAHIAGFTVQPMAQRPFAQELIVGASIDPLFGPVLLFGQGGTAVEVLADRAIGLPPLNRALA